MLKSNKFWIRHDNRQEGYIDYYTLEKINGLSAKEYNKLTNIQIKYGETKFFKLIETTKTFGKLIWILRCCWLAAYTVDDLEYIISNKKVDFPNCSVDLLNKSFIEYSPYEFHEIFGMTFCDREQRKFELIECNDRIIKDENIVLKQPYRNFIIRKR